ncbi:zinc finger protein ZAT11-like [Rhodamnia argentea]|uniref:Zinc finger protein ZAT11-like n=1 Tax=Rhodamnia argentea TaxID=178133 RepID=A0A8B8P2P5_9MYRT|nr:zinc finger protein ZAT11-like [Rhodamnia argentea]
MKRACDNGVSTMSLDMANCLMFLSCDVNTMPRRTDCHAGAFECKTCKRQFHSFQALGGHRTSHKRQRLSESKVEGCTKLRLGSTVKPKMHECSICGLKLTNGQALGGHMRKHRANILSKVAMNANSVIPVFRRSNSNNRRVMSLDLNLSPLENDLKILLGQLAPRILIH